MTPEQKVRRKHRQETVRNWTKALANTSLGLRLTNGQLKAAAKTLYYIRVSQFINNTPREFWFWWENNERNS